MTQGQWVTLIDSEGTGLRIKCEEDGAYLNLNTYIISSDALVHSMQRALIDDTIVIVGEYNPANGESTYNPGIAIPRLMYVLEGEQQPGVERFVSTGGEEPYYSTVHLQAQGVTVTASGHTFTDCIRLVVVDIDTDSIGTSIYYLAKGVGIVKLLNITTYESGSDLFSATSEFVYTGHGTD